MPTLDWTKRCTALVTVPGTPFAVQCGEPTMSLIGILENGKVTLLRHCRNHR